MSMQTGLFGPMTCPFCGATSPNQFAHDLNHHEVPGKGMCVSQWLRVNQLKYQRTHGDEDSIREATRNARLAGVDPDQVAN